MATQIIDFRSDTATMPCKDMRRVMSTANVGDDVLGEDPSIIALQKRLAKITKLEDALFFPSGTQSNLVALLTHCQRGDEFIVAQNAHIYRLEGGGAAVLGGIQPQPVERNPDGTLNLDRIKSVIKSDDIHFPITRLIALENTTTEGFAINVDHISQIRDLCRIHGLSLHLDGARVFNAATALDIDVSEITSQFDTVSICLSKGLGAPVGSVLCGSREFIERALRWRKTVGGGMRQCGMLAAAGLYALENNIDRLIDDHENANHLCKQLQQIDRIEFANGGANTNILFFNLKKGNYDEFVEFGKQNGVLFGEHNIIRMVTHKDVSRDMVDEAVERLSKFFG